MELPGLELGQPGFPGQSPKATNYDHTVLIKYGHIFHMCHDERKQKEALYCDYTQIGRNQSVCHQACRSQTQLQPLLKVTRGKEMPRVCQHVKAPDQVNDYLIFWEVSSYS